MRTWEASEASIGRPVQNVGDAEREASALGGAGLILAGLRRRSLVGLGLAGVGVALVARAITGRCGVYSALNVSTVRGPRRAARPSDFYHRGVLVDASVTIDASPESLYRFWRNFENLPLFMRHVRAVRIADDMRSHWTVRGPARHLLEWDAEIINDEPPHLIAWRSLQPADVDHAGSVRFVPVKGGEGTHVKVRMEYLAPGGRATDAFLHILGEDPRSQVKSDLNRLKELIETGDVPDAKNHRSGGKGSKARNAVRRASRDAHGILDHDDSVDAVQEASEDSFPASDPPGLDIEPGLTIKGQVASLTVLRIR